MNFIWKNNKTIYFTFPLFAFLFSEFMFDCEFWKSWSSPFTFCKQPYITRMNNNIYVYTNTYTIVWFTSSCYNEHCCGKQNHNIQLRFSIGRICTDLRINSTAISRYKHRPCFTLLVYCIIVYKIISHKYCTWHPPKSSHVCYVTHTQY